jgi:uncharacterized protein (TIGR01777 family)
MKIGITGASGFIGHHVTTIAKARGHECVAFSRNPGRPVNGCAETRRFSMNGDMDLNDLDAIIHLAGESVIGLWTNAKKQRIRSSRVAGTRSLVQSIGSCTARPRVLVSGSATGYYGDTADRITDESAQPGSGFLSNVCIEWETEAEKVTNLGIRVVRLRTGMVLGADGGALRAMIPAFKFGLGAELGDGEQWMAWIHVMDEAALILYAIENDSVEGALNGVSPNPVQNGNFTTALADALGRPAIFRVPAPILRMALGGFSAELLNSSRVVPARALNAGFSFQFPNLEGALEDILNP